LLPGRATWHNAAVANESPRRFRLSPLADCVEAAVKPSAQKRGLAERRLLAAWRDIVGATLAAQCMPEKLSFPRGKQGEGTLTLRVGGSYALEVQHAEPVILEKIAGYFGYRAVAALRLVQAPLPIKPRAAKRMAAKPLSPSAQQKLEAVTAHAQDADLRQALERLGAAVYRQSPQLKEPR